MVKEMSGRRGLGEDTENMAEVVMVDEPAIDMSNVDSTPTQDPSEDYNDNQMDLDTHHSRIPLPRRPALPTSPPFLPQPSIGLRSVTLLFDRTSQAASRDARMSQQLTLCCWTSERVRRRWLSKRIQVKPQVSSIISWRSHADSLRRRVDEIDAPTL